MSSVLTRKQVKKYGPRFVAGYEKDAMLTVEVRYDDDCGNGHNSFAITGDIRAGGKWLAGGCVHEEIAKHFPELAPFIKWHLMSSDGPMHYIQNTVYLAGERDCSGKLKGEPKQWETSIYFGKNPITHHFSKKFIQFLQDAKPHPGNSGYDFEVLAIPHENRAGDNYKFSPKYTFGGYDAKWHECPFDSEREALDFLYALQNCEPKFVTVPTAWGEGKARELDAARHAAIWPDATDEELMSEDLADKLRARLPKLLEDFQKDIESLGFVF